MSTVIEYACCVCGKQHRQTFPLKVVKLEVAPRSMAACKDCGMMTPHRVKISSAENAVKTGG